MERISLEELHTLLAERYEAEISKTSGNFTTKKANNCSIFSSLNFDEMVPNSLMIHLSISIFID
ncbi:hypothetical protein BpHYR1_014938 [Brachionus plicatilis]|uniref:Uncharacterized protein n=1 Tax=Brachionus plicatilis TaxID=10195 RepID=A0A3M7SC92_BRAPC|nr:hypothetical protein BpHYR1_014938 [Brachionus plicatilis]